MPPLSIRDLAKQLPYSRTTISDALRGSPRVNRETAEEIRAAAAAAGFRTSPLASALMSEMRRSRSGLFRGVLAAVILDEAARPAYTKRFFDEVIRGASGCAINLGFEVQPFLVDRKLPLTRLDTMLEARGIHGLILLPAWDIPDFSKLRWARYAGVYTDYIVERPALHTVCPDHHRAMTMVLQRLRSLGYRRPGFITLDHHDERLHRRWEGAFLAFQRHHFPTRKVPPFVRSKITKPEFARWFRSHRPDVIVGHHPEVMDWMRELGARIPETHGFFCLNNAIGPPGLCAGLDQQPSIIGARAAEIVIAQLHRNEFGISPYPTLTTIQPRWVDGASIRSEPSS